MFKRLRYIISLLSLLVAIPVGLTACGQPNDGCYDDGERVSCEQDDDNDFDDYEDDD
jgi:hypothetical protein